MTQPYVDLWRFRFRTEVVPQLPDSVVLDGTQKLRGIVVGVARACADLADFDTGHLRATVDTIAASAGVGRKVAMPVLTYLHDRGVVTIEKSHGRGTSTRRRLTIDARPADESPVSGTVKSRSEPDLEVPHPGLLSNGESPLAAVESPSSGDGGPSWGTGPHRPHTPVSPSPQVSRAIDGLTDEQLETIRARLGDTSTSYARRVANQILARAGTTVVSPLRYVLAGIDAEPDRYRPTPGPPKKANECQTHPGQPASNCGGCAADAKAVDR